MKLDAYFLVTFFFLFVRVSSMVLSAPVFGGKFPSLSRLWLCAILSLALVPIVKPFIGEIPSSFYELASGILREVLVGVLIGSTLHMLSLAAQMAGSFLDLQIGLSAATILNPSTGLPVTILAQFKYLLATLILLLMNGHHWMLNAFVKSYTIPLIPSVTGFGGLLEESLVLVGKMSLLALQIAAPVAAVCVVIDAAVGVVNKSVPTFQAYFVSLPAKLVLGILALSLGLPLMVNAVQVGLEHVFDATERSISAFQAPSKKP